MRLLHIVVASKACLMLGTSAILSKFLGVWFPRLVVEYEPRNWLLGLFDRLFMKQGVEGALGKAIENLERRFNFLKT